MRRFSLPLLWIVPLCLAGGGAAADTPPSRWERAADPAKAEAWDLHVNVSEVMAVAGPSLTKDESERKRLLERVRDALEGAHAATSPELALRFDLGEIYERIEHFGRAIEVLEPALALAADDDPRAERAWNALATAYAKTDDSRKEIHAYDRLLALTVNAGERARILANRAEAEMRLAHLDLAVEGYKDALAVSESATGSPNLFVDGVLAHWGLTVALDRSGDVSGSAREATLTVGQNGLDIIQQPYVFFVPDYELFYYIGLGRMALAKQAGNARQVAVLWGATEGAWTSYVAGAEKAQGDCETRVACLSTPGSECEQRRKLACPADRWLPLAKAHLARAQKERAQAEKRAGVRISPRVGAEIRID
jgi:hypothetical protein